MEPMPNGIFLSEVFRRLADAESANFVLRRERDELIAKQSALLAGPSSPPASSSSVHNGTRQTMPQHEHARRPEPEDGEVEQLRSRLRDVTTAFEAHRLESQRLARDWEHASRNWQVSFNNAQQGYTHQLNSASAEINRLQNILKERDDAISRHTLSIAGLEKKTADMKTQLEAKEAELQRTMKEKADAQVRHDMELRDRASTISFHVQNIAVLERTMADVKSQLGAKEKELQQAMKEKNNAQGQYTAQAWATQASTDGLSSQLQTSNMQLIRSQAEIGRLKTEMSDRAAQFAEFQMEYEKAVENVKWKAEQINVLKDSKSALESIAAKQQEEIQTLRATVQRLQKPPVTRVDREIQVDPPRNDMGTQTMPQVPDVPTVPEPEHVATSVQTMATETELLLTTRQLRATPRLSSISSGPSLPPTPVSLSSFRRTTSSSSLSSLSTLTESDESAIAEFSSAPPPVIELLPEFKRDLAKFQLPDRPKSMQSIFQTFSLEDLHTNLGGSEADVVSRFDQPRKVLAVRYEVRGCIFLRRRLNPWAPPGPGEHGYMLMGNWNDDDPFCKPFEFALFLPEDQAETRWRYYGQYLVQGDVPLLPRQWRKLPDDFREDFYSMTLARTRGHSYDEWLRGVGYDADAPELQEIRARHSVGLSRVPRIQMICVGYHEDLVQDLSSGRRLSTREVRPTWKRKDTSSASFKESRGSSKKRRVQ
ncbi:hypothetical protein EIP86_010254 [Pleurotus ostreatoroseus]|nr:hypothetical protein EIP86_010254 [Pleurotus ostreatoroseus]